MTQNSLGKPSKLPEHERSDGLHTSPLAMIKTAAFLVLVTMSTASAAVKRQTHFAAAVDAFTDNPVSRPYNLTSGSGLVTVCKRIFKWIFNGILRLGPAYFLSEAGLEARRDVPQPSPAEAATSAAPPDPELPASMTTVYLCEYVGFRIVKLRSRSGRHYHQLWCS